MAELVLSDDVESVDFNSTNYKLEDGSFDAQIPQRNEIRSSVVGGDFTRDLLTMSYKNRNIIFSFYVLGDNDISLHNNISKITRMLIRSQSEIYLSGGGYQQQTTTAEGNNTGDAGLRLKYRVKNATTAITNEDGDADVDDGSVYFKVISGDIEIDNQFKSAREMDGRKFAYCTLTLECEPFALGVARVIGTQTGNGFYAYPISPDYNADAGNGSQMNRMFISAASIPGEAPALTRISTKLTGSTGLIIARDAGISILNSTTFPVRTGTGLADFFVYGQRRSNSNRNFRVRISSTGSPDMYQYSDDDGSTWSSAAPIVAKTKMQLGSYDIWIMFWNATGHTSGDYWSFKDRQSQIDGASSTSALYTNRNDAYSETGYAIGSVNFTVPQGCTSRYRVLIKKTVSGCTNYDIRMNVEYYGFNGSTMVVSKPVEYSWVRASNGDVDLGMIDLTPRSLGLLNHPNSFTYGRISYYIRAVSEISVGATAIVSEVFLVPAQDEYSYMFAAWDYDGAGREIYCNYDPNNPYLAEVSSTHTDGDYDLIFVGGLDYTMAGNVITLIPNVDNTLLFLPMFSPTNVMDWRYSTFSTGAKTNTTTVAIRPRYLYGG